MILEGRSLDPLDPPGSNPDYIVCSCETEAVIGSSFTPSVALTVHVPHWHRTLHRYCINCHKFTRSQI